MSKTLDYLALIVVFIGALNWGLIGLFRLDLVRKTRKNFCEKFKTFSWELSETVSAHYS